jgi:hypothetical protein
MSDIAKLDIGHSCKFIDNNSPETAKVLNGWKIQNNTRRHPQYVQDLRMPQ